ncbi:MAG: hypothetical protein FJY37_02235 [Betaproteobacteria bacterium]|nr:hypothetical protein [Betaproteobacteria bacterium]
MTNGVNKQECRSAEGRQRQGSRCRAVLFLALTLLSGSSLGDDDERLRAVEETLRKVTEELNALKAAGVTGSESAQALDEARRANEKADALEQRMNQQGLQARFSEGIRLEDPKGDWSLRIGGRVQLDYRNFSPGDAIADTFSLRRVRAGVDAVLYKDFRIVVEAEFANGNATGTTTQNVALTNGFFDIGTFGPGARLRLGQFKPAFGYEQTILDLYSDYMERSFAQSLLQNLNYDRGFMVYGAPARGMWYGLTVANGTGLNLEEKQGNGQEVDASKPELALRLTANAAQLLETQDKILQLGASYRRGELANSAANPYTGASVQTEARGITFFAPAAFNAIGETATNIKREFLGYEYLFSLGGWKLQGEHVDVAYRGIRQSPSPSVNFTRRLKADYVSLMWLVTGESFADYFNDSTIGKIRPRNRFAKGSDGGWGALELGLRFSWFDGSDFSDSNPARTGQLSVTAPTSTSTAKASATTFQIKWIPNAYTWFWFNLVNTRFDTPVVVNAVSTSSERAYLLRGQIDF